MCELNADWYGKARVLTHNQLKSMVHLIGSEERLVETLGFCEITFCIAGIVHSYKPYQVKGSVAHLQLTQSHPNHQ